MPPSKFAVIFTSRRAPGDQGYAEMARAMETLARKQPGFLGLESVRDPESGVGITVSYWQKEREPFRARVSASAVIFTRVA